MGEFRVSDPRWLAYFHIHYRLAPHYRNGRTFLAGDAAHVHSLLGGQGMNTGLQDAHNLAWKLALVIRGIVPESWLDSYEVERRQVAADVIAATKAATETAELFAELSPIARERLVKHMFVPESQRMKVRRHQEEIDLDYRTCALCIESENEFQGGPHAGARAVDAESILVAGEVCRLYDLLTHAKHSWIMFAPATPAEQLDEMTTAAESVLREHGDWISVYLVTNETVPCAVPDGVTVIEDPQHSLCRHYGIESTGAYLIRPDGYVAFRSRRCDSLGDYLDRVH